MTLTIFILMVIWAVCGILIFSQILDKMPDRKDKFLKQSIKIIFISILLGPISFFITAFGGFFFLLDLFYKKIQEADFLTKIGNWIIK